MKLTSLLVVVAAGAALLFGSQPAAADHSWANYHWPSDKLAPTVANVNAGDPPFDVGAAVAEWAGLGTPIQPSLVAGNQGDVTVQVKRIAAVWLGVAKIKVDGSGHILEGKVELNSLYLNSLSAAEWDHVLCQELGHVWGLDHNRDGATGGSPDDTCMNDQGHLGEYTSPNAHDAEELDLIYSHADSDSGGSDGGSGGPGCPPGNPNHPRCAAGNAQWLTVHVVPAR